MLMAMKMAAMERVTMRVVKLSAKVPTITLLEVKLSTCERGPRMHTEGASLGACCTVQGWVSHAGEDNIIADCAPVVSLHACAMSRTSLKIYGP